MVRRLARPAGRYRKPEPKLLKIELVHEGIDGPHHIIETNVILNAGRKKARLLPADAGLEGTNRHKTNRTPMRKTGYEFLPGLACEMREGRSRITQALHPGYERSPL